MAVEIKGYFVDNYAMPYIKGIFDMSNKFRHTIIYRVVEPKHQYTISRPAQVFHYRLGSNYIMFISIERDVYFNHG